MYIQSINIFPTSIGILCILLLSAGCSDRDIVYSQRAEIGGAGWTYADSIEFVFEAPDTVEHYSLLLDLSHDQAYPWENAYVKILTAFPDGHTTGDTVSLELANDFGAWLGKCRGDICRVRIPLREHVRFPSPGTYSLTFIQFMRQETIAGISGLQLMIQRSPGEN